MTGRSDGVSVAWPADPALARIWQVLRRRLEDRGLRAEGRVVLTGLSREERHAAAAQRAHRRRERQRAVALGGPALAAPRRPTSRCMR